MSQQHLPTTMAEKPVMASITDAGVPEGSVNHENPCSASSSSSSSSASSLSSSSLPSATTNDPPQPTTVEEEGDPIPPTDTWINIGTMDLSLLPPLPTPNFDAIRREMAGGVALVNILILSFVGLTHGVALTAVRGFEPKSTVWWTFFSLIYACASTALLSLLGLFATDPGVVKRSPDTCFPIPAPADFWIASQPGQERGAQQQNDDEEDQGNNYNNNSTNQNCNQHRPKELYIASPDGNGDSYCVRCLVWRRQDSSSSGTMTKYFHCTTCQRCVKHFDHHCSIFGRCIAGKGLFHGNLKYFVAIIASGVMAYFITVLALIWSLSIRFGAKWAIPISLVVLWVVQVNIFNRNPTGMCMVFRQLVISLVEWTRNCFKGEGRR